MNELISVELLNNQFICFTVKDMSPNMELIESISFNKLYYLSTNSFYQYAPQTTIIYIKHL